MLLINGVIVAMTPVGVFATAVYIIKRIQNCTYEHAVWYIAEVFKDMMYQHNKFWLHMSDFPHVVKTDIESLMTDDEIRQWNKVLQMKSNTVQWYGKEGTAYYAFVIPWKEENEEMYRGMIEELGRRCLREANCTTTDVVVDFWETNINGYYVCRIRYARTVTEQEAIVKILNQAEEDIISKHTIEVHDFALDAELEEFRKDHETDDD